MENRLQNGVRTNHDRDTWTNGPKGGAATAEREEHLLKGKAKEKIGDGSAMDVDSDRQGPPVANVDELPDELQHITIGILPLDLLLKRLAQFSHVTLQDQILTLASRPLPQNLANGNANYHATGVEDTSPESLEKKVLLLNTIQELHTKWVKTLVITEWSKKADQVGKLIDLRSHLMSKLELFNATFFDMIRTKQDLLWAKVPSPDLKTALEVLANGEASWMPDFGYLEPPPLSPAEKEAWLHEINVYLSARLGIHEWEKIPEPFRNYTIDSGRVTFRVEGEFEVDLTIGDEDFETQFWFIDFRCLFSPAPSELSGRARAFMELKVNEALATEGLLGCYKYLHEFTLTAKVGEFARQAVELSTARWVDTLKIERLDRALSIQYWLNRPHSQGTKSWIILGVNSGKGLDGGHGQTPPSHLTLRWFRDGKEVKDIEIQFDTESISTENLLTTVVNRHIEYLLSSMHNKLLSKPRFTRQQARLALKITEGEDVNSSLTMQLLDEEDVTVQVEPLTGTFVLLPRSAVVLDGQRKFNSMANPAEDGPSGLEQLRWIYTMKDLHTRSKTVGWAVLLTRPPISGDEVKSIAYSATPSSREPFQAVWMRIPEWDSRWFVMMSMSLGGDNWWLIELSELPSPGQRPAVSGSRLKSFTKLVMSPDQLRLSSSFFHNLAAHTSAVISRITELRDAHKDGLRHSTHQTTGLRLPPEIRIPTLCVPLSELVPARPGSRPSPLTAWANKVLAIDFKGLGPSEEVLTGHADSLQRREMRTVTISEARLSIRNPARFRFIKGNLDRDIFYNPRIGQFTFRLRVPMGTSTIRLLASRLQALERLLDFVEAIRRAGKDVVPESVTLREIVFTYGDTEGQRPWKARLDLSREQRINVILEKGNPHLRIIDHLRTLANSARFEDLPAWLIFTLPLCRALERLEDTWGNIAAPGHGSCYVFHNSLGWVGIRFVLSSPLGRRLLHLTIRAHKRGAKPMWHVTRSDCDPNARNENDDFNKVLKQRVWSTSGSGFKGLSTGAAAHPGQGIENLIALIGESILSMVSTPPSSRPQLQQQQQQPQPQPQPQPQMQQQPQPQQIMSGPQRGAWTQHS